MGRPKRIRRTLALQVTEPQPANPNETWTPGQRFASGWQDFRVFGMFGDGTALSRFSDDPIRTAGFLAARAAWDAHHYATNWIEIQPTTAGEK